nr:MAG TPA: hypothetical protein [Caudoviricetes sp.]
MEKMHILLLLKVDIKEPKRNIITHLLLLL